jgi:hypothetical protein
MLPPHGFSYEDAINLTKNTIQKRARSYRNMVVVLSLLLLLAIIASLWFWSLIPLAYLLFFWPVYSLFLLSDQLKIYTWKKAILSAWQVQQIELGIAHTTIKSLPYIPAPTIDTLFATLPDQGKAKKLAPEARETVLQHQQYLHKLQKILYVGNLIRSLVAVILILVSAHTLSWAYLTGLPFVFIYQYAELGWLSRSWNQHLQQESQPAIDKIVRSFDKTPL